jgi:hypothetical protein
MKSGSSNTIHEQSFDESVETAFREFLKSLVRFFLTFGCGSAELGNAPEIIFVSCLDLGRAVQACTNVFIGRGMVEDGVVNEPRTADITVATVFVGSKPSTSCFSVLVEFLNFPSTATVLKNLAGADTDKLVVLGNDSARAVYVFACHDIISYVTLTAFMFL